jgi:single-stranded-DNA-specific exonuclease
LPDLLCRVLARRGVDQSDSQRFLEPTLRDLMSDPRKLLDMDAAASRIIAAVDKSETIAIFADYDVDGACSAALLINWLGELGQSATLYVPDRQTEGYGPNVPAMAKLAKNHDLIICVDCGTVAHDALSAAKGADVVVLDHHLGAETLPPATAVVNPNRQDETSELTYLCAAGVVFMLLVELNRRRREASKSGPDLIALLDLVALATVADVAPLIGLNRAFVRQGLAVMAKRNRPGITALADVGRITSMPSSYHLGFVLGPRLNAGGRIGASELGTRLLTTTSPHDAAALAERLDGLNTERRDIEAAVLAGARAQAETRDADGPLIWAASDGWHPGVVGIVASRLKDQYNRPAVVIAINEDQGTGSGRSVSGIDLGAAVARCTAEGVFTKGGGHKMAAGLSLSRSGLEDGMARLAELLAAQGAHLLAAPDLVLSGSLMPAAATAELIEAVEKAGPFGAGAPAPRVAFASQKITFAKRAGENHLRLTFADDANNKMDAIAFSAFETALGPALENHKGARFHLAGRLEIDTWGGRYRAKLRLEDAAPA